MKKITVSFLWLVIISLSGFSQQTKWLTEENGSHSTIGFSIDHLVVSEVNGEFGQYTVSVMSDKEDFSDSKINFEAMVASIDTEDEQRDKHLRSEDFFDAQRYETITFESHSLKKVEGKKYQLVGDLTIKGVTRLIILDVSFGGVIKDPWGNKRAGFKISGSFDRGDFGLNYNSVLDNGGYLIGEEVRISCNVELIKQA